jgi:uncharacterized protein YhhL (DUF1145 family)
MKHPHWRKNHMETLDLVLLNKTKKKQKELLFLNVLRPFCNLMYSCQLYTYFRCIYNVKNGDLQLTVFISVTFVFIYLYHGLMMTQVQGRNYLPRNKTVHKVLVVCD